MSRFAVIERASIDEAYMDLTNAVQERLRKMRGQPVPAELLPTTFIQGLPDDTDAAAAQGGSTDCKGTASLLAGAASLPLLFSLVFVGRRGSGLTK